MVSTRSEPEAEGWAEEMLRRHRDVIERKVDRMGANGSVLDEAGGVQLHESNRGVRGNAIEAIAEGRKFDFLRDIFCRVDEDGDEEEEEEEEEEEDEGEEGKEEEEEGEEEQLDEMLTAWDTENGYYEGGRSRSSVSEADAEQGNPRQDTGNTWKIWEWTRSDSEAEQWYFDLSTNQDAHGYVGVSRLDAGCKAWEWTRYDSEAEREEAKRISLKELRERDEAERNSMERMRRSSS